MTLAALEDDAGVRNKPSGRVKHHRTEFRFETDEYLSNSVEFSKSSISRVTMPNDTSRNRASFTAKPFYKILRALARDASTRFQASIVIHGSLSGAAKRSFQNFSLYDFFAFKLEPRSYPNASQTAEYSLTEGLTLVMV